MNLPTEIFGAVVVAHAPEEVSRETADGLQRFLSNLDRSQVVLELDGAETIDSAGLEALVLTQQALREAAGDLKISSTNPVNRKILEITRLDAQLEVYESVIDAVRSFA